MNLPLSSIRAIRQFYVRIKQLDALYFCCGYHSVSHMFTIMPYSELRMRIQFISNQILKLFSFLQWKNSMGVYFGKISRGLFSIPMAWSIDGGISAMCYFKINANISPDDRRFCVPVTFYIGTNVQVRFLIAKTMIVFVCLFVFVLFSFVDCGVDREMTTAKRVCMNIFNHAQREQQLARTHIHIHFQSQAHTYKTYNTYCITYSYKRDTHKANTCKKTKTFDQLYE